MNISLITEKEYAELGRIAFKFLDRMGDPHPDIDDAETICAEAYTAMTSYLATDVWPRIFPWLEERKNFEDPLDRA